MLETNDNGLQVLPTKIMRGKYPAVQSNMRLTRINNKVDEVTETVLESFFYDRYKESLEPSVSDVYREELFKETNLKDMGELGLYLWELLKKYRPKLKEMNVEDYNFDSDEEH